jgi:hypothetical protein
VCTLRSCLPIGVFYLGSLTTIGVDVGPTLAAESSANLLLRFKGDTLGELFLSNRLSRRRVFILRGALALMASYLISYEVTIIDAFLLKFCIMRFEPAVTDALPLLPLLSDFTSLVVVMLLFIKFITQTTNNN